MASTQAGEITSSARDHHASTSGPIEDDSVLTVKKALKDIAFGSVSPASIQSRVRETHPDLFSVVWVPSSREWSQNCLNIHLTWLKFACKHNCLFLHLPLTLRRSTDPWIVLCRLGKRRVLEGYIECVIMFIGLLCVLSMDKSTVQGLPAPIVGSMAETAALFVTYTAFQNGIRSFSSSSPTRPSNSEQLTIPQLALAAGGAGFLTSFVLSVLSIHFFIRTMK